MSQERMKWVRPGAQETGKWEGSIGTQQVLFSREQARELGIEEVLDIILATYADHMQYDETELVGIEVRGLRYVPNTMFLLNKRES